MALKIKPEHMSQLVAALLSIKPMIEQAKEAYKVNGCSQQRILWDSFRAAMVEGNSTSWLCNKLYPYMNDKHMDSALREAFKQINFEY